MTASLKIDDLLHGGRWKQVYRALSKEDRRVVQVAAGQTDVAQSPVIAALAIRLSRRQMRTSWILALVAATGFIALAVFVPWTRISAVVCALASPVIALRVQRSVAKSANDFNWSVLASSPQEVTVDEGIVPSRERAASARRDAARRLPRQMLIFVAVIVVLMIFGYGIGLLFRT